MDEAKTGRAARTDHRLCRAGGNWRDACVTRLLQPSYK